jgi:hypothetical protein
MAQGVASAKSKCLFLWAASGLNSNTIGSAYLRLGPIITGCNVSNNTPRRDCPFKQVFQMTLNTVHV